MEGRQYAAALHADGTYQRLGRSVDLSGVTAAQAPTLSLRLSFSTTVSFDHVIIEAAPSGTDQWTTLPRPAGRHVTCPAVAVPHRPADHPPVPVALPHGGHALRTRAARRAPGTPSPTSPGVGARPPSTSSVYAGGTVDVKISYVANVDVASKNGVGVFVDDTRVHHHYGRHARRRRVRGRDEPVDSGGPAGRQPTGARERLRRITSEAIVVSLGGRHPGHRAPSGYGVEALATPQERLMVLGRASRPV